MTMETYSEVSTARTRSALKQDTGDGRLRFGGWVWRYDLAPTGPPETKVTLSYDWSAVPGFLRQHIGFPPFPPDHLGKSLAHLAGLAAASPGSRTARAQHCPSAWSGRPCWPSRAYDQATERGRSHQRAQRLRAEAVRKEREARREGDEIHD